MAKRLFPNGVRFMKVPLELKVPYYLLIKHYYRLTPHLYIPVWIQRSHESQQTIGLSVWSSLYTL